MKLWKVMPCILLCFFSPFSFAEVQEEYDDDFWNFDFDIDPVVTASGGVAFASDVGSSEEFTVGFSQLNYQASDQSQVRGVWGLFLGGEFELDDDWDMQLGASYYQSSIYGPKGTLVQGFNENSLAYYDYNYQITARQILAETKVLGQWYDFLRPYVSVGIGVGINTAESFSVDYPEDLAMTPVYYGDHTISSFTYNLGLGVDVELTEYLRFGVGYRFTDFGEVGLSHGEYDLAEPTASHENLSQDHFYVQEILFQVTLLR
ncbi:MAG: outer membrane beta-barrel protein [Gammaproteobacteria bacterium]|jgi:opacity protein-like surface antigen